ncbi:hypothetical protein Anas_01164 [Armadillidium nasatum]|uniref:Complex I assembly factor TIMMDC1, mitochondrial n=1 Tax=Armadillidium nasatum TaxID=96803 RepID=A0A5N5SYA8_9CRUS|nr:hypothetical protein Anas_01164 [Armadillidium nasatum]
MRFTCGIYKSPFLSFALLPRIYKDESVFDRVNENNNNNNDDSDSGWKRLKEMYTVNDRGLLSPQFETVFQGMFMSFIGAFVVGGISTSKETYLKFVEENKTTAFISHFDAKRKLQDAMTLSLFRGGWRSGWRLSVLTGSVLTVLFSLEKCKGYTSISDFTVAGALPCGLYNFKRGPKPLISGLFVGGIFGTLAGVFLVPAMKLTGVTLRDIYKMDENHLDVVLEKEEKLLDKKREKLFETILPYKRGDGLAHAEFLNEYESEKKEQTKTDNATKQ